MIDDRSVWKTDVILNDCESLWTISYFKVHNKGSSGLREDRFDEDRGQWGSRQIDRLGLSRVYHSISSVTSSSS